MHENHTCHTHRHHAPSLPFAALSITRRYLIMSICSASADCGSCTMAQVAQMQAMFSSSQVDFLCTSLLSQTVNSSTGTAMLSGITAAQSSIQGLTEGLNCTYIFLCAALVFVMHAGFAMVSELEHCCALVSARARYAYHVCSLPRAVALRRSNSQQEHHEHLAPDNPGCGRQCHRILHLRVSKAYISQIRRYLRCRSDRGCREGTIARPL